MPRFKYFSFLQVSQQNPTLISPLPHPLSHTLISSPKQYLGRSTNYEVPPSAVSSRTLLLPLSFFKHSPLCTILRHPQIYVLHIMCGSKMQTHTENCIIFNFIHFNLCILYSRWEHKNSELNGRPCTGVQKQ